jgi:ABC-2 type transport system permease protein
MRTVIAVVRREYLQRVRNKWFILSTVGLPVFMIAVMAVPIIREARSEAQERVIVLVDQTEVLYDDVVSDLGDSFEVERIPYTGDVVQSLDQRIADGEIAGFLLLTDETLSAGSAVFRGSAIPGTVRRMRIQRAVVQSVLRQRLGGAVSDAEGLETLLSGGAIQYVDFDEEGLEEGEREAGIVAGFVGALMLYMVILLYGVQVMRAVLEEKTTRIVEIIISAMKPWQLMLGKILGVGAVGLTQLGIWALSMVLLVTFGLPYLVAARPELLEVQTLVGLLPVGGSIALFIAFFVTGFFLFSSLYAAVAAMCSSDEEAQQSQIPVTMLLVIPIMFLAPVMENPNGTLATWLSLVPFFTPVLMFPRFIGGAPLWQVGLSLVLVALTVVVVAWVAGRIYRVGILMQGKRPTLPELMRWVRESS